MREITKDTVKLGEKIKDYQNNAFLTYTDDDSLHALEESYGTNIIPQFVKTYYEKTHRKLIVVMASHGGEEIGHFAKTFECHDDENDRPNHHNLNIYEVMTKKYQAAIDYMSDHSDKYIVGKKFYIVFQGESDAWNVDSDGKYKYESTDTNIGYYDVFMKVHNSLKDDLGLEYGGIVYTGQRFDDLSREVLYNGVLGINREQKSLITSNNDLFLASSYPYSMYYSFMHDNNTDTLNCICPNDNNHIHFTSAALSQIGMDSAISAVNQLNENVNWLKSLKINDKSVTVGNNNSFEVNVENNIDKAKITAETYHSGLTFVNNYGPREVNLNEGKNTILLKIKYGNESKDYTIVVNRTENKQNNESVIVDTAKEDKTAPQIVSVEDTLARQSVISLLVSGILILLGIIICLYTSSVDNSANK